MKVLLTAPVPEDLLDELAKDFELIVSSSREILTEESASRYADIDGWVLTARQPITASLLDQLPQLKVASVFAVGYDNIDVEAATERGVTVCNTPGVLDDAVATLTIGLMIGIARRIPQGDRYVRNNEWQAPAPLTTDMHGKSLGILGMGRIGAKVAKIGAALGMNVLYHNRNRDLKTEAEGFVEYRTRDALITEADFLSLNLPLNSETRGSFGTPEFEMMKDSAYLINTARGAIVDEGALINALTNGLIAGAGLDVFEKEPLPGTSPLLSLDNVVLQPHAGSATHETRRGMIELAVTNLRSVLNNAQPPSPVNSVITAAANG